VSEILISGEQIRLPKIGECFIDLRLYETGEVVVDGDKDPTATMIELPSHGRLGDLDELVKEENITYVDTGYWMTDYEAVKIKVINKAPTIVKASK